jgi:hypothetical protein
MTLLPCELRALQPAVSCQRMRKTHSNQDTENPSFELIFCFRLKEAAKLFLKNLKS